MINTPEVVSICKIVDVDMAMGDIEMRKIAISNNQRLNSGKCLPLARTVKI
jgi:hypothetical protein